MPELLKTAVLLIFCQLLLISPLYAQQESMDELARLDIIERLNEFLAGASRNDAQIHNQFWSDELVYTSSNGTRFGKAELMAGVREEGPVAVTEDSTIFTAEDIGVRFYGETAVLNFTLVGTTGSGEDTETDYYLNSGTFIKDDGRWQAVNWQATIKSDERKEAFISAELSEAIAWYTGEAGRVDDNQARLLLEHTVATGDVLATMWLARVYSRGRMTFSQDSARAELIAQSVIEEIETMALQGNPEAGFLLGTAYAEGLGKVQDVVQAAHWYALAGALGVTLAQHNMGNIMAAGTGVEKNEALAIQWWLLAAEKGDAIPQYRLGVAFENGSGTIRDMDAALRWYREAASRGNNPAVQALQRLGDTADIQG